MSTKKILCIFDIDGTLTKPRQVIDQSFKTFLIEQIMPLTDVGLVGGSDLGKITEQLDGPDVIKKCEFAFPENGLVAFRRGKEIGKTTIQQQVGEAKLQEFINFVLKYLSTITLPLKRGTFVEFRTGLINICPIGRSCSQVERDAFEKYDNTNLIRQTMIDALKKQFPDIGLSYTIGGQISFDVFPTGWDKRYCLRYVENEGYNEIHFFGDKTDPGGNDYEIFNDPRVIPHKVTSPEDTKQQLKHILCPCRGSGC